MAPNQNWDYVDASELTDGSIETAVTPEEIPAPQQEERQNYFEENFDKAIAAADKAAGLLVLHDPAKTLKISNSAITQYRNALADAYRSEATPDEIKASIINQLQESDKIVGVSEQTVAALEEKLQAKIKELEEMKEILADEYEKIDNAAKSINEEIQKEKDIILENINEAQKNIEQHEKDLNDNLTNPEFDKQYSIEWIEGYKSQIEDLQDELLAIEEFLIDEESDLYYDIDLRLSRDIQLEIQKLNNEIEEIEAKIHDVSFEVTAESEVESKWMLDEHKELCALKTAQTLDFFAERHDIDSMQRLEGIASEMKAALAKIYRSYVDEAAKEQASGDIDTAIELLKKAREIKDEYPNIHEYCAGEVEVKAEDKVGDTNVAELESLTPIAPDAATETPQPSEQNSIWDEPDTQPTDLETETKNPVMILGKVNADELAEKLRKIELPIETLEKSASVSGLIFDAAWAADIISSYDLTSEVDKLLESDPENSSLKTISEYNKAWLAFAREQGSIYEPTKPIEEINLHPDAPISILGGLNPKDLADELKKTDLPIDTQEKSTNVWNTFIDFANKISTTAHKLYIDVKNNYADSTNEDIKTIKAYIDSDSEFRKNNPGTTPQSPWEKFKAFFTGKK